MTEQFIITVESDINESFVGDAWNNKVLVFLDVLDGEVSRVVDGCLEVKVPWYNVVLRFTPFAVRRMLECAVKNHFADVHKQNIGEMRIVKEKYHRASHKKG